MNFKDMISKIEKARADANLTIQTRFGTSNPPLTKICSRCNDKFGNHYSAGKFYCPDEWVAAGHSISEF